MGQRLVIVSSPLGGCVPSLRFGCDQSLWRCLYWGVGFSSSSGSVGLLSDPVAPFLEETFGVPVRVTSSSSLHGEFCLTLFLSFPGCFGRVPPSPGCDFTGLVASGSSELEATLPVHSVRSLRRSLALVRCE